MNIVGLCAKGGKLYASNFKTGKREQGAGNREQGIGNSR
jgi:hypothetical protein